MTDTSEQQPTELDYAAIWQQSKDEGTAQAKAMWPKNGWQRERSAMLLTLRLYNQRTQP